MCLNCAHRGNQTATVGRANYLLRLNIDLSIGQNWEWHGGMEPVDTKLSTFRVSSPAARLEMLRLR